MAVVAADPGPHFGSVLGYVNNLSGFGDVLNCKTVRGYGSIGSEGSVDLFLLEEIIPIDSVSRFTCE